jgi:signal transduction histidine kinase
MGRDETIVLRVCDFGPGLPAELEDRAFDRAVRGPASTGQGFGLHVCRRLLEEESGQIYIQRRRGRGCTVVIELPAAASDGSAPELADRLIS